MPKSYKDCTYSAFISYAHSDNDLCFQWVSHFCDELLKGLQARLRGEKIRDLHMSENNGPVKGDLSRELKERIHSSFAMIIVVHQNYVSSDWCLEELKYFKQVFGDQGFLSRLYILALSEKYIGELTSKSSWQEILPYKNQVWKPFFRKDNREMPPFVYHGSVKLVSPDFIEVFEPLVNDLAKEIENDLESSAKPNQPSIATHPSTSYQMNGVASTTCGNLVLYIESNQNERTLWEPLGEQIKSKWDEIIRRTEPRETPQIQFSFQAFPIDDIDQYPTLEDAAGVVLLWGKTTPATLIAHIKKVERRLYTHDRAPRIVAYLMPPQPNPNKPLPAWGWSVLRFDAEPEERIAIVRDESEELERFLLKVLKHTTKHSARPNLALNSPI